VNGDDDRSPDVGVEPSPPAPELLAAPAYHRALRAHLEATEPELWAWFAESAAPSVDAVKDVEVELLKTSYRLDGGLHGVLTAYASLAAGRLDLTGNITLYQELGTDERNARVLILGDDVHIVFGGDLLDLLTLGEQQAVLAHELAHVSLWQRDDKAYWILDQMIHRLAADPAAADAVGETARRLRLHTEVFADAISAEITDDRNDVISAVVKVNSGLRSVDPEAYLRQARQILEADPESSRGWTHPELHVRVACLAAQASDNVDELLASLIEGPDELDRIDLLGQFRLQELTGRVLACGRQASERGTSALAGVAEKASDSAPLEGEIETHIDMFPSAVQSAAAPGARPTGAGAPEDGARGGGLLGDGALADRAPSVRHLCGALLVDVALAPEGRATGLDRISPISQEADRLGVAAEFDKILARATERTLRDVRKLHTSGAGS